MTDTTDPAASLEGKINAFADSLTPDELTVLHDVIHLAYEGSEVQGFAMPKPVGLTGNPCDGGHRAQERPGGSARRLLGYARDPHPQPAR